MIGDIYEVYVCKLDEEILYVGQGKSGRNKHCKSGVSHVYELNSLHFQNVEVEVDVVFTSYRKSEVEKMELKLISELQPKFNKVGNSKINPIEQPSVNFRTFYNVLSTKDKKMWYKHRLDIISAYNDMKKIHNSVDKTKPFVYDTVFRYEKQQLVGLRRMANNFKKTKTYSVYFLECYNEVFYKV